MMLDASASAAGRAGKGEDIISACAQSRFGNAAASAGLDLAMSETNTTSRTGLAQARVGSVALLDVIAPKELALALTPKARSARP